jgi:LuxR family maltose regulon positive regulatory protein
VRLAGERFRLSRWLLAGGLTEDAAAIWRALLANDDPRMHTQWAPMLELATALRAWVAGKDGGRAALSALTSLLAQPDPGFDVLGLGTELRLRTAALALTHGASSQDVAPWVLAVLRRHAHDADIAPVLLAGPQVLQVLADAPARGQWSAQDGATLQAWAQRAQTLRTAATALAATRTSAGHERRALDELPSRSNAPLATPPQSSEAAASRGEPLTARELEILERLAAGDSNKLIARAFDLSPHTVKRHVANILDKLDMRSRGQAAAWFHASRTPPAS